jgi:hypothetical protein
MISAVFTKWGWVSAKSLYRFKKAYGIAVEQGQSLFMLNGVGWDTRFVGYLIEYCESEGLVPEKTDADVPLFEQEQGRA